MRATRLISEGVTRHDVGTPWLALHGMGAMWRAPRLDHLVDVRCRRGLPGDAHAPHRCILGVRVSAPHGVSTSLPRFVRSGRAGVCIPREERQVRNDARRDTSATGLISLHRSFMNPATSSVREFDCFFALFQLVGELTEGRQEGMFLALLQTPRSPALGRAAEPAAPRPGLAEQNRRYRTRLAGPGTDSLMSARAHRDVHRRPRQLFWTVPDPWSSHSRNRPGGTPFTADVERVWPPVT